jgi:perosamine synthetase
MDPSDLLRKITPRTKAIMAVHLYGQVCNMTEIMKIANKNSLYVLEDCAQCYLGEHRGQVAGTIGHVGSWSFENSKHLTTGDGGIITCDDEDLADRIRKLNTQGFRNATAISGKVRVSKDIFQNPEYKRHDSYGFMYRLPEVAAAIGLAQIEKIDEFVGKRRMMGKMYCDVIESLGCNWLVPQKAAPEDINVYYTFGARFLKRDVSWSRFRAEYVKNGGDGIYAAWALCYLEDSIPDIKRRLSAIGLSERFNTNPGICPVSEHIQPQLMQFTTNQKNIDEMKQQAEILYKTIKEFM